MSQLREITHPVRRILILGIGLFVMSLGIACSIKAELGTSPISSLPYVTGVISGLSTGTTTIIMNVLLVFLQIALLREKFQRFQLLQLPLAFVFGTLIDLSTAILAPVTCGSYLQQWLCCILGILLLALGVSIEVTAELVTNAGEGIVLTISQVSGIKFGNAKILFDLTLVCTSAVLSLLFLRRLDGVREGTLAAAIFAGLIIKRLNPVMKRLKAACLP